MGRAWVVATRSIRGCRIESLDGGHEGPCPLSPGCTAACSERVARALVLDRMAGRASVVRLAQKLVRTGHILHPLALTRS